MVESLLYLSKVYYFITNLLYIRFFMLNMVLEIFFPKRKTSIFLFPPGLGLLCRNNYNKHLLGSRVFVYFLNLSYDVLDFLSSQ